MKSLRILALILPAVLVIASCSKSPWVADVDGNKITLDEFNTLYYAHHKSNYNVKTNEEVDKLAGEPSEKQRNPLLDKEFFLDEIIKQRLVFWKAEKENVTDSDEYKAVLQIQRESLVASYYAKNKFEEKATPTDAEIAAFYEKEKAKFKGATIAQAGDYIKQQLMQRKLMEESQNLVEALKEKAAIEKNADVLAKLAETDKSKRPTSGWVAKIDGKEISVEEFENLYYAQNMNAYNAATRDDIDKIAAEPSQVQRNPLLARGTFLDEVIKQRLVYNEAVAEKMLEKEDLKANMQLQMESICTWYYVKHKFANDIEVSDAEVAQVYQQQQGRFKGVPITSAEAYIRQGLKGEKLRMKNQKLISDLKDEARIEKKTELLTKKADEAKK